MTPDLASKQAQATERARLTGGPIDALRKQATGESESGWEGMANRLAQAEGALVAVEGQLEEVKGHLREVIEAFDRRDLPSQTGPRQATAARWLDLLEGEAARTGARESTPTRLSEREVEVLRLIAAGKSNQEIAEALVISRHTVIRHVSNIFAKSGAANRAEAAAYATRRGLV